jgi:DNA-binding CsgD family transcriptional regulator/RecA/RadA recombinase
MLLQPAMAEILDQLLEGPVPASQIIQITGEPWIGKTRLLTQLCARAAVKGYKVASGQAERCRSRLPFEPFADALDRYLRDYDSDCSALQPDELAALERILSPASGVSQRTVPDSPIDQRRLFAATRSMLERLAGASGLILTLDDFHRADHQSIELLAYLARNPPRPVVVIAVAYRSSLAGRRIDNILDRACCGDAIYVELKSPPADQLDELFPPGYSPVRKQMLRRDAGDNPGAVLSLLSADLSDCYAAQDLIDGHPPVIPDTSLVDFGALSPLARRVARAAAVSGEVFDPAIVAAVAQLPEESVLTAIDELQDEDVLRPADKVGCFRFQHPLTRVVVYHSASAGWGYGAQSRAARVLGSRGAPSAVLACHLEHLTPDDPSARKVLLEGARQKLFTAPTRAKRWLRRLLDSAGDNSAEAALLLAIADALLGLLPDSLRTYSSTDIRADTVPPGVRAQAAEWRVRVHRLMGRLDEARRLAEQELRTVPGSIPLRLERLAVSLEDGEIERAPGQWVPPAAADAPDPALRAQLLSLTAVASLATGRIPDAAQAAAEAARVVGDLDDDRLAERMETLRWLGEAEAALGQLDAAAAHLQRGFDFALWHGQSYLQGYFSLALSGISAQRGDLDTAKESLHYAEDVGRRDGTVPVLAKVAQLRSRLREDGSARAVPQPSPAREIAGTEAADDAACSAADNLRLLSQREREVADFVSAGHTNQQIAHRLKISHKTVETYMSRIFQKLGICSRAQIALAVGLAGVASAGTAGQQPR